MPIRTRKQLGLLYYLARRAGRPSGRDELIDLLWGSDAERAARHSLSQSVSLVNKVVGHDVITSSGRDRVLVERGLVWLDVDEFERAVAEGRNDEALALWRGPVFEGTWVHRAAQFERWMHEERDRLQRVFRRVAQGRLELLRAEGNHAALRDESERLLQVDPLDEKAMLAHLESLTLLDDRVLALRRYGQFERRLREELDAEPGSSLRIWVRRHRKGDGEAARPAVLPRVSEWTVLPTPQPLYGRTEEFAVLWEGWEQAKIGRGSFIIVEGEAGIGKTALATKLVNQAHVAGGSVCFVRCYRTEKSVPFAPVTSLIRQLSRLPGFVGLDPVWIGELTRLVPELRERYPHSPIPMAVDDAARHRLSDGTVQAALAVADELPLMIVIDDLQDADEASLAVIHYLSRQANTPVLLIGSTRGDTDRTGYEKVFFETVRANKLAKAVRIHALTSTNVELLIQQVAANHSVELDVSHVTRIAKEARGNPLHAIEAVIATLHPPTPADKKPTETTDSFESTVHDRFAALEPPARLVAGSLAIAGHPLSDFEIAEVTALRPADLAVAMWALEAAQFVARLASEIGFSHELYTPVVQTSLTREERVLLHNRIATSLASRAANNPAMRFEAARHFAAANQEDEACANAQAAARFAADVGAVHSEAEALELALQTACRDRDSIVLSLGDCYVQLNEFSKFNGLYSSMSSIAIAEPRVQHELDYLSIAAAAESGSASMRELEKRLTGLLSDNCAFDRRRAAQMLLVRIADKTSNYSLAKRTAQLLRRSNPGERLDRYSLLATAYVFMKYYFPGRALPLLEQAMVESQLKSDWPSECLSRDLLGIAMKQTGRIRDSIRQFNTSLALARKTMNPNGEARALQNRAVSEMSLGDWDVVLKTLDEADSIPNPSWGFRLFNVYNRGMTWMLRGDTTRSCMIMDEARELARRHEVHYMKVDATAVMALCCLRSGDVRSFDRLSSEALALEDPEQSPRAGWVLPTAMAWRRAIVDGDREGALAMLTQLARRNMRLDVTYGLAFGYERILLLEYGTHRRAQADREALGAVAERLEAEAIKRSLA